MTARRILPLIAIVVAILLERFAYYGVRSGLVRMMTEQLELPHGEAFRLYRAFTLGIHLLPFVVAPVLLLVGPRIPLVVSGFVSALGMSLLSVADPSRLPLALAVIAIGAAGVKVGLYSLAGELLAGRSTPSVLGVFSMAYVAINVGAFTAPLVLGFLGTDRFGIVAMCAAGVMLLATTLSGFAAAFSSDVEPTGAPRPIGLLGAGIYALAGLPVLMLLELSGALNFDLVEANHPDSMRLLLSLNPVTIGVFGMLVAGGMFALASTRVRLRPEWLFTAGCLLFAASAVPLLFLGDGTSPEAPPVSLGLIVACSVTGAIGEFAVMVAGLSRVATCASSRIVPLGLASWFGLALLATTLVDLSADPSVRRTLLWAAVGLTVVAGIGIAALSGFMDRSLFKPEPAIPSGNALPPMETQQVS